MNNSDVTSLWNEDADVPITLIICPPQVSVLSPQDKAVGHRADELKFSSDASDVPDFPAPAGRELLLRTCVARPAPYSKALPQRLFCVLMKEEFRLAGAFSSDTSFF